MLCTGNPLRTSFAIMRAELTESAMAIEIPYIKELDYRQLRAERDARIVADRRRGMPYHRIAQQYGLTPTGVLVVLKRAEKNGETGLVGSLCQLGLR
jgi:hypothetical protein